jgi:hypothetical protein
LLIQSCSAASSAENQLAASIQPSLELRRAANHPSTKSTSNPNFSAIFFQSVLELSCFQNINTRSPGDKVLAIAGAARRIDEDMTLSRLEDSLHPLQTGLT